jgi:hypothetical protein
MYIFRKARITSSKGNHIAYINRNLVKPMVIVASDGYILTELKFSDNRKKPGFLLVAAFLQVCLIEFIFD